MLGRTSGMGRKRPLRHYSETGSKKNVPTAPVTCTRNKIPHYAVDRGFASPNWVNPRTGACFRATADGVGFYYKFNPDPKKPDTVWGDPVKCEDGQS